MCMADMEAFIGSSTMFPRAMRGEEKERENDTLDRVVSENSKKEIKEGFRILVF